MSRPCVFCEIVAGRAPSDAVLFRGARHLPQDRARGVLMFTPLGPVTPGHVLFIPAVHVADAATDPDITGEVMGCAARYAAAQGVPFNLITSAGRAATQSVFHLHVHYVPRRPGDGLPLPWTGQREREVFREAMRIPKMIEHLFYDCSDGHGVRCPHHEDPDLPISGPMPGGGL